MRGLVVAFVVLLALVAFAAPATPSFHVSGPSSRSSSPTPSLVTDAVALPRGVSTSPLAGSVEVSTTLTLANPNTESLSRFLGNVENPSAPQYRHFLSFSQFVSDYSPTPSEVARVSTALESAGARDLTVAPDRSSVTALVPARSVEALFGVQLVVYGNAAGLPLYTAIGPASLPSSLEGLVSGIGGLSDRSTIELAEESTPQHDLPVVRAASPDLFVHDNVSGQNWYLGSDYTQAYGATALLPGAHSVAGATYPTGAAVATLLTSAFNQTDQVNLPPWDPAVIDAYFNGTLGPGWPVSSLTGVPVTIGGTTPPMPGSFGAENDSTLFEVENSLDLEMAGSLAPGAPLYNFYFAASLVGPTASIGSAADYLAADLQQALAYNYAPAHLATVSCSFGLPDLNDSAWNAELLTAAATGVTILSASGDQGNAPNADTGRGDGQWPVWPATAAFNTSGAVSVGGVSVGLSGTPTSYYNQTSLNLTYDPNAGTVSSASTWWDTSAGQGSFAGSEGGVSTVYSEPWWQFHSAAQPAVVNATVLEGQSALGRAAPDLAMPANLTIATIFANATGVVFFTVLEGTSVAAPVLAGLFADVVAVETNRSGGTWSPLGFIDPEVYRIASYFAAVPAAPGDPFMGVTVGHNFVFSAAPGWNPTTGWGQVDAPAFLAADRNTTLVDYNYTGSTPGLPPPSGSSGGGSSSIPWTYIFLIFIVGIVVAIVLVVATARAGRRNPPVQAVPWGAQMGAPHYPPPDPAAPSSGATMTCPYCGALRPAGPVRCPQCGAF